MKELIAKKYVKALFQAVGLPKAEEFAPAVRELAASFQMQKMTAIITSPDVSVEDKEKFILDLVQNKDEKLANFLKLLNAHNKLEALPQISKELDFTISKAKNEYRGLVVSGSAIDEATVNQLQESFCKKVNANVVFEQKVQDYDGVKLVVDDLGIEIGFSRSRLKNDITEHILKAI